MGDQACFEDIPDLEDLVDIEFVHRRDRRRGVGQGHHQSILPQLP
jgi:hypothetical protein